MEARKVGQRAQTEKKWGHFAKGVITEVDDIGIDGIPYYRMEFDSGIVQWRPATDLIDDTSDVCDCHSCCYVFNKPESEK